MAADWRCGQTASAQIQIDENQQSNDVITIVQTASAQIINPIKSCPKILEFTTLSNHIEILCRCKNYEERLFYILYANKERLAFRELQRCITNQTCSSLLSSKENMSKGFQNLIRWSWNML